MEVRMGCTLVLLAVLFIVLGLGVYTVVIEDFLRLKLIEDTELPGGEEAGNVDYLDLISLEIEDE